MLEENKMRLLIKYLDQQLYFYLFVEALYLIM
jgi:hypothetical protein